jgi:predicted transposase/invertase (TIGR01784 family)
LKKTITINILDFDYVGISNYHTVFHLWEDKNKDYKLTDVLEIHFIELSKFKKVQPDFKKPIDRWLLFLEDSPKEVLEMAMKEEPAIEKAEKVLEYLGTNEEMVRYYELREKQIHDEITRITGAKIEVAKKMLADRMDISLISKYTGLSTEDLVDLKAEIDINS